MKCPNCNREAADAEEECPCGVVLSKWRKQASGAPAPAKPAAPSSSAPRPAPAQEGGSVGGLILVGLLLIAGVYYALHDKDADSAETGGAGTVAGTRNCAFSGEVVDIYTLSGVRAARVDFGPKAARTTDAAGHYWIRVQPEKPYTAKVSAPKYLPGHIDGFGRDWREAPLEQRVHAARSLSEDPGQSIDCSAGAEKVLNFALVPLDAPADLKAQIDAVPQ